MKKIDSKIESLCGELEHIVNSCEITVDVAYDIDNNTVYRISILNSDNDIFSIRLLADEHSYLIRVYNEGNYYKSSESVSINIDIDDKNAERLIELIKSKYNNKKDKEKIEKIDKALEILNRLFKEDLLWKI